MSKKKPVVVTITKTKHAKQPFTVTIDKPGKAEPYKLAQRYKNLFTAKRGALRNLNAVTHGSGCEPTVVPGREWNYSGAFAWFHEGRDIVFVIKGKKK